MESERKSRYELFLEEEARKAQPTNQCLKCKATKSADAFHKDRGRKNGLFFICKECRSNQERKYRDAADYFWKHYWPRVERVGDCYEWTGTYKGDVPICHYQKKRLSVRRIVYMLAVGDFPDDLVASPLCGNQRCVRHSHIRPITKEEREIHRQNRAPCGSKNARSTHPENTARGSRHGCAKLAETDIIRIRDLYAQGNISHRELGQRFGVSAGQIGYIVRRETWKHVE